MLNYLRNYSATRLFLRVNILKAPTPNRRRSQRLNMCFDAGKSTYLVLSVSALDVTVNRVIRPLWVAALLKTRSRSRLIVGRKAPSLLSLITLQLSLHCRFTFCSLLQQCINVHSPCLKQIGKRRSVLMIGLMFGVLYSKCYRHVAVTK